MKKDSVLLLNVIWIFGITLMLLSVFLLSLFWDQTADTLYSLPFKFLHHEHEWLSQVDPQVEEKLNHSVRGYITQGETMGFGYSSWHDLKNNKYYYRFENLGTEPLFASCKELFAPLTGRSRIFFQAKEKKFLVVSSKNKPSLQSSFLTLCFQKDAVWSIWYPYLTGTSMSLYLPANE